MLLAVRVSPEKMAPQDQQEPLVSPVSRANRVQEASQGHVGTPVNKGQMETKGYKGNRAREVKLAQRAGLAQPEVLVVQEGQGHQEDQVNR